MAQRIWEIPRRCELDDAEFNRFKGRYKLESFERLTSRALRSCRNWFLETLPEHDKYDSNGNSFTLETCLWKIGNYISCAKQMPNRETILKPKNLARTLAIQIILEWLREDVPANYGCAKSASRRINERKKLMVRILYWARSVKNWYPHGTQRHGRFTKKNVREFARALESALQRHIEQLNEDCNDPRINIASLQIKPRRPAEKLLF